MHSLEHVKACHTSEMATTNQQQFRAADLEMFAHEKPRMKLSVVLEPSMGLIVFLSP